MFMGYKRGIYDGGIAAKGKGPNAGDSVRPFANR
jgi:hypothetical protein